MENVLCGSVSVQCQGRGNDDITDNAVDGVIIGGIAAAAVRVFFYQMSREQPISPRCPFHSRREFNYMKNAQEHCPMYVLLTVANPFPVPSPFHIYLGRKASSSRSRIGTLDLTQGFLRLTLSNYDVT